MTWIPPKLWTPEISDLVIENLWGWRQHSVDENGEPSIFSSLASPVRGSRPAYMDADAWEWRGLMMLGRLDGEKYGVYNEIPLDLSDEEALELGRHLYKVSAATR